MASAADLDKLERAYRSDPGSTAFVALAQGYLDVGRAKEAVKLLEEGVRLHPNHGAARLALGRAYGAVGRWPEAERELSRASSLLAHPATPEQEFAVDHDTDPTLVGLIGDTTAETNIEDAPPAAFDDVPTGQVFDVRNAMITDEVSGQIVDLPIPGMPRPPVVRFPDPPARPAPAPAAKAPARVGSAGRSTDPAIARISAPTRKTDPSLAKVADPMLAAVAEPPAARAPEPAVLKTPDPPVARVPDPPVAKKPEPAIARAAVPIQPPAPAVARKPEPVVAKPVPAESPAPAVARKPEPVVAKPVPVEPPAPVTPAAQPANRPALPITVKLPALVDLPVAKPAQPMANRAEPAKLPDRPAARMGDAPGARSDLPTLAVPANLKYAPLPDLPTEGADDSEESDSAPVVAPVSLDAYLNRLLDARPIRERPDEPATLGERWGQRLRHPFVVAWIVLGVAAGGVLGWLWLDARQRAAEVELRDAQAHASMRSGAPQDLASAVENATLAVARDPGSVDALATLAAARTLALHLHGQGQLTEAGATVVAARQMMKTTEGSPQAHRDLALAEAALALGSLDRGLDAKSELAASRIALDREVDRATDDQLLVWLDGQLAAATGDRARARTILARAAETLPAAALSLAELDLDDGDLVSATGRLERIPNLPVAVAEDRLARAVAGMPLDVTPASAPTGPGSSRAAGWLHLADFYDARAHGDHARELDDLRAAGGASTEARFLAWLALAEVDAGRPGDGAAARARLRTAGVTPIAAVVDGELYLAEGKPTEFIPVGVHPRTHRNRGRGLLADGKYAEAAAELDTLSDPESHAWAELAHYLVNPIPRPRPPMALTTIPNGVKATADNYYFAGEAWLAAGESGRVAEDFNTAMNKGGGTYGYRAQTRLAELALAAGKPADAEAAARAALAVAPGYPAAHAVLGRALLARGTAATEAGAELQIAVDSNRATSDDELAYAEVALALGHPDLARDAAKRAQTKGASPEALTTLVTKIDPALLVDMGLVKPNTPPPKRPAPPVHHGK